MRTSLVIIDDFYIDPDKVRDFALSQPFDVVGNFPGKRTKPFLNESIKDIINNHLAFAGGVSNWQEESGYTGAFQLTTALDRTWIHTDEYNKWAGVCYLTPNAPHTGGTGLFRHKESGEYFRTTKDYPEGYDYTKWDLIDVIGNKYNRLVLYRGDIFHASLDYFGSCPKTGRLFQTFFFDTKF